MIVMSLSKESILKITRHTGIIFIAVCVIFSALYVEAQRAEATPIECGDVVQGELTEAVDENHYVIDLVPGDIFIYTLDTLSDLEMKFAMWDPADNLIEYTYNQEKEFQITIAATGTYRIDIEEFQTIGVYTLSVSCVKNDEVIEAGTNISLPMPDFGFASITPQDFSEGVTIPLQFGLANPGSLSSGFKGIFGYSFSGTEGDIFDLAFERLDGNLNLGLGIISADNTPVFQTSLISTSSLTVDFTLPTTDEYTIGIYVLELAPPDSPESTNFTIQVSKPE